jgi:hypothetical protein
MVSGVCPGGDSGTQTAVEGRNNARRLSQSRPGTNPPPGVTPGSTRLFGTASI